MDHRGLQILRELGELGSVRAVADALHITPSAVSQQLKLLQRGVAVPLTERRGRTLALTDAGTRLAEAAADVEVALARARDVAQDLSRSPRGSVGVSAFNSAALAFFAPLARRFHSDGRGHGHVRVRLGDEDVAQVDFPPLTSRYDIVLAHRFRHTPPWPSTVVAVPLLTEPLDVALPRAHPLSGRDVITATDVAELPWITTHTGFPVGAFVDALSAVSGRPIEVVHRVNEFTVVGQLVLAGAGVALLPRWTSPPPAGVVLRPLDGDGATRSIDALVRPEQVQRPAVRAVLDGLSQIAADIRTVESSGPPSRTRPTSAYGHTSRVGSIRWLRRYRRR